MDSLYLFSYAASQCADQIQHMLRRITRAILMHRFYVSAEDATIHISADPSWPGAFQVRWALASAGNQQGGGGAIVDNVDHLFMPAFQRLMTLAIDGIAWPNRIIQLESPTVTSPVCLHAIVRNALRRVICSSVDGIQVSITNGRHSPLQDIVLGQPLGWTCKQSPLMAGQVQERKVSSRGYASIKLVPEHGRSRTLLIADGIDPADIEGKTIVALVRPVRGRIGNRLEAWMQPQYPLF